MRISSTGAIEDGAPRRDNWEELVLRELVRKAEDIDADAIIRVDYLAPPLLKTPIERSNSQNKKQGRWATPAMQTVDGAMGRAGVQAMGRSKGCCPCRKLIPLAPQPAAEIYPGGVRVPRPQLYLSGHFADATAAPFRRIKN